MAQSLIGSAAVDKSDSGRPRPVLLIIAYGNTLRGDDGAGPVLGELIERCCKQRSIPARLQVGHQLTPEMALDMIRPDIGQVLFCDTRVAGRGDCDRGVAFESLRPAAGGNALGHHLSPATLLLLAEALYRCTLPAWQATVPGFTFQLGQPFSEPTREALENAAPLIEAFLFRVAAATISDHPPEPIGA